MVTRNDASVWDAETEGFDLLDITLGDLLDRQAEEFGSQDAVVYRYPEEGIDLRLGFRDLRDRVDAIARGLLALGVGRGDKVAILATNIPEWLLLELAVPKIGAILVTVNTNVRRSELEYLLRQAEIHTLFLIAEHRGNPYLETIVDLVPELPTKSHRVDAGVSSEAFPSLRHVVLLGAGESGHVGVPRFTDVVEAGRGVTAAALRGAQAAVRADDVSQIQFTSGTTGAPKGAMITHRGTLNNARLFGYRAGFRPGDRMVTAMPFFHTAGNVVDVLGLLAHGGTLVKAIQFDPLKMLQLVEQERATILHAVPTMLIAMLQHPRVGEFDTSSLRLVLSGGTPIPVPVLEQVKAQFGADPVVVFGMTEASPLVTATLTSDTFELKSATVGKPLPHLEVKIVDGSGAPVPHGQPGELLVRGFGVMKGYYRMPEKTAEAIDPQGWLHSGDLATMDREGYIRIVGRIKDMIIRGGENVYPAEVESFLMRHPAIKQAQIVGIPDPYMGEEAAAFIQVREGQDLDAAEVEAYCRANMSRHKLPKYIRFVTEYPVTPSGKVKKFELREKLLAQLQAGNSHG
ncbi:AMP-binding protein [Ramlibacter sp. AW1]|uniref:AMP-binding protein n=1 Tax=Ramlibacter aurantiacus TaxID=2801330 RepID=A0A937D4B3_9BURK|nr:AMP-binding protein [Ramlibacter aurantiacus]MBL0418718.1 AMP-binding protein [Ramlibacter aurantiacus]